MASVEDGEVGAGRVAETGESASAGAFSHHGGREGSGSGEEADESSMQTWRKWLAQTPRGTHGSHQWFRGFLSGGFVSACFLFVGIHLAEIPAISVWVSVFMMFFVVCCFRKSLDGAAWIAAPCPLPSKRRGGGIALPSISSKTAVRRAISVLASPGRRASFGSSRGPASARSPRGPASARSRLQGSGLQALKSISSPGRGDRVKAQEEHSLISHNGDCEANPLPPERCAKFDTKFDLPENIWSLAIVCAVGQASFAQCNIPMPTYLAFAVAGALGGLQSLMIFLIVHDLDEFADPITKHADDPWIHNPWTVNVMKYLMILFLTASLVNDAHDCANALRATVQVHEHQLAVPRWTMRMIPLTQYCIIMGVAWGGTAVVLSCQDVLSILCNSLSITFIVNADELFYAFFEDILDLAPDLLIVVEHRPGEEAEDDERRDSKINTLEKIMVTLPMAFSLILAVTCCLTGDMPTKGLGLHDI